MEHHTSRRGSDAGTNKSRSYGHTVACGLALAHLLVWYVWRPTEDDLTPRLLMALSSLKIVVLVAVLWQLRQLHVSIGLGTVSPKRAMGGWTLGLVATLAILMPLRETIAATFDTVTTHLVAPSQEIGYTYRWLHTPPGAWAADSPSEEQLRHRQFVVQWRRGEILTIEALLAGLIVLAQVGAARKLGRAVGILSVLVAGVFSIAACWVFGYIFGLVLITYDTFYLGAMAGPLAVDFVTPTALYPETPLAAPFYVALAISSWTIAAGRSVPTPVRCKPDAPIVVAQANG